MKHPNRISLMEGQMDFLVMLGEGPAHPPVLARIDSVPEQLSAPERGARDVVTLYGTPSSESLALALAAAMESRRTSGNGSGAFRHLGVWSDRGAVGDAVWRDRTTGQLVTQELDIPLGVLVDLAGRLQDECGPLMRRLVAGLAMPDWPEGTWRAIHISLDPTVGSTPAALSGHDSVLDLFREADGLAYDHEGD